MCNFTVTDKALVWLICSKDTTTKTLHLTKWTREKVAVAKFDAEVQFIKEIKPRRAPLENHVLSVCADNQKAFLYT